MQYSTMFFLERRVRISQGEEEDDVRIHTSNKTTRRKEGIYPPIISFDFSFVYKKKAHGDILVE